MYKEMQIRWRAQSKKEAQELEEKERWSRMQQNGYIESTWLTELTAQAIKSRQARAQCRDEEETERQLRMCEATAVTKVGRRRESDRVRVGVNVEFTDQIWPFLSCQAANNEHNNVEAMDGVCIGQDPRRVLALLKSIRRIRSLPSHGLEGKLTSASGRSPHGDAAQQDRGEEPDLKGLPGVHSIQPANSCMTLVEGLLDVEEEETQGSKTLRDTGAVPATPAAAGVSDYERRLAGMSGTIRDKERDTLMPSIRKQASPAKDDPSASSVVPSEPKRNFATPTTLRFSPQEPRNETRKEPIKIPELEDSRNFAGKFWQRQEQAALQSEQQNVSGKRGIGAGDAAAGKTRSRLQEVRESEALREYQRVVSMSQVCACAYLRACPRVL